jgi:hypothetical protein
MVFSDEGACSNKLVNNGIISNGLVSNSITSNGLVSKWFNIVSIERHTLVFKVKFNPK